MMTAPALILQAHPLFDAVQPEAVDPISRWVEGGRVSYELLLAGHVTAVVLWVGGGIAIVLMALRLKASDQAVSVPVPAVCRRATPSDGTLPVIATGAATETDTTGGGGVTLAADRLSSTEPKTSAQ